MMNSSIIIGEAPESDSDSDQVSEDKIKTVLGEAPESDEDDNVNVNKPDDKLKKHDRNDKNQMKTNHVKLKYEDSLFKLQLRDLSRALASTINDNVDRNVLRAKAHLKKTSQLLVQTQMTMQSTIHSMRKVNGNINALHAKLDLVTSLNYLPDLTGVVDPISGECSNETLTDSR